MTPETRLDYFGARYYSAAQGKWLSSDWSTTPKPVPYADFSNPQTLNLYSYLRNNPLNSRDADGHGDDSLWDRFWAGLGMAFNAMVNWKWSENSSPKKKEVHALGIDPETVSAKSLEAQAKGHQVISTALELADPMPIGTTGIVRSVMERDTAGTIGSVAGMALVIPVSSIGKDKALTRLAEEAGKSAQSGIDSLTKQLFSGNLNPGIGTKHLFGDISYARARDGARVFFRQDGDTIEILAKASKKNEARVIKRLEELYKD